MCRIARELNLSSVIVLRKGVCSLFIPLKIRSAMHVDTAGISRQSYESYIFLRDRIEVGLVKVSTMVCGFTFGSISLHLISKRKKEILTQKHQYNVKYYVIPIDLVTVFDAILTSRQMREKLQCLYENLMLNNFCKTAVLKKNMNFKLTLRSKGFY